jgi:hypothetical protein
MATGSWRHREDTANLGNRLIVIEPIREDAQGKNLHPLNGFLARLTVSQNARKFGHFRQPTAIFFSFDFDGQWHNTLLSFFGLDCSFVGWIPELFHFI